MPEEVFCQLGLAEYPLRVYWQKHSTSRSLHQPITSYAATMYSHASHDVNNLNLNNQMTLTLLWSSIALFNFIVSAFLNLNSLRLSKAWIRRLKWNNSLRLSKAWIRRLKWNQIFIIIFNYKRICSNSCTAMFKEYVHQKTRVVRKTT